MIVIPMAGQSSRFKKAGYSLPKHMLELNGLTLFEHSLLSFSQYFTSESFLFVVLRDGYGTETFVRQKAEVHQVGRFDVVTLDAPTRGQAETVFLGLMKKKVRDEPITIFNVDTFRPNFTFPVRFLLSEVDGYLETFIGAGPNWSNILPDDQTDRVILTAEKQEISPYCCTGLYYWRSSTRFCEIFSGVMDTPVHELFGNEYYIAPLYNQLIGENGDVRFTVIDRDDVIFCGTPCEYEGLQT